MRFLVVTRRLEYSQNSLQRHYITTKASHFTHMSTVCSAVWAGWHHRKHQIAASLALFEGNLTVTVVSPSQRANILTTLWHVDIFRHIALWRHTEANTKWQMFYRWHFKIHFPQQNMVAFWIKFRGSLILIDQMKISHFWQKQLHAEQMTSHCLSQWCHYNYVIMSATAS